MRYLNIGQNKFEKTIGWSNGYISKVTKEPSYSKLMMILVKYPQLNIGWLLTGEGEMLKENDVLQEKTSSEEGY